MKEEFQRILVEFAKKYPIYFEKGPLYTGTWSNRTDVKISAVVRTSPSQCVPANSMSAAGRNLNEFELHALAARQKVCAKSTLRVDDGAWWEEGPVPQMLL